MPQMVCVFWKYLKVTRVVVCAVACLLVVDNLIRPQISSQFAFHNQPVLPDVTTAIRVWVAGYVDQYIAVLVGDSTAGPAMIFRSQASAVGPARDAMLNQGIQHSLAMTAKLLCNSARAQSFFDVEMSQNRRIEIQWWRKRSSRSKSGRLQNVRNCLLTDATHFAGNRNNRAKALK